MIDLISLCLLAVLTVIGIINLVWKVVDKRGEKPSLLSCSYCNKPKYVGKLSTDGTMRNLCVYHAKS